MSGKSPTACPVPKWPRSCFSLETNPNVDTKGSFEGEKSVFDIFTVGRNKLKRQM